MRVGECARVDVPDFELSQGSLLVRNGKGKEDRAVPVPARAKAALDVYLRPARPEPVHDDRQEALFLSYVGRRLSATFIEEAVRGYGLGLASA